MEIYGPDAEETPSPLAKSLGSFESTQLALAELSKIVPAPSGAILFEVSDDYVYSDPLAAWNHWTTGAIQCVALRSPGVREAVEPGRVCRPSRPLTPDELIAVQFKVQRPLNSNPDYKTLDDMVAARPDYVEDQAARDIAERLMAQGYTLNPNAPGNWLWEKHIIGTSCQHNAGFVTYGGVNRLRAYSWDLLANTYRDACDDEPVEADLWPQVEKALVRLRENEIVWSHEGFTCRSDI